MAIQHSRQVTVQAPVAEIDLEEWVFGLSDDEYQACARGHHGAGRFEDERGRGTINVESVGGNLIVQHYRPVQAQPSRVEMYSPASRVYLAHVVPVRAAVRWTLEATAKDATSTDLTCAVKVDLPIALEVLGRLTGLNVFLRRHVNEETQAFGADIARKQRTRPPHAG